MKKLLAAVATTMAFGVACAQAPDTLKRIKDSGAVTMGVREAAGGLSYALGGGKYAGFHVELCQRVLADVQKSLGLAKLKVSYQLVSPRNRIILLQNGRVDIECGSTTNNLSRQRDAAFAVTTYVDEVRIAVKANAGINSVADLKDRQVATTVGSTSVRVLRKHERARGIDFKEVFGKSHADSFVLLQSGRADAFVMDGQVLAGLIARAKNPADYRIVGEVLSVEPIAIMLRKNDPAFKQAVDDSLKALMVSGEMARLHAKWFTQPIAPKDVNLALPASEATQAAWAQPNDKPAEAYAKK